MRGVARLRHKPKGRHSQASVHTLPSSMRTTFPCPTLLIFSFFLTFLLLSYFSPSFLLFSFFLNSLLLSYFSPSLLFSFFLTFPIPLSHSVLLVDGGCCQTLPSPTLTIFKGREKDHAGYNERFLRFRAQRKGQSTTRILELPLEMPQTSYKSDVKYVFSYPEVIHNMAHGVSPLSFN